MRFALTAILFFIIQSGISQDLENLGKEDPMKISASFNATGIGYAAHGIPARRDPLNYFFNGGMNLSLYGWSIPFSFSWSNQNRVFQQPFNQYGIAPQYKWVKTYFGYNNMNFSRYSLAGHIFLGAGAEFTPGNFRISTMYGRLNRATPGDSLRNSDPVFKRMGYGIKIGYASSGDEIDLVFFKAFDILDSAGFIELSREMPDPQENVVISLIGKKSITKRIYMAAEYAISGLTRNLRVKDYDAQAAGIYKTIDVFMRKNTSTSFFDAFNSSLNYNGDFYSLNVTLERIDPGYTTLGAYYFNNDMQNLTVGGMLQLLKQKLNINANVGTQKNNLERTEINETKRMINSFNINYIPSNKWNINTSYSNFTTFTNIRPQLDPFFQNELDTLNFYQINQNASTTISYSFGEKEKKKNIFFTGSYQATADEQEEKNISSSSTFVMGNFAFRFPVVFLNATASVSANLNHNEMPDFKTMAFGPNANISRVFLDKKLRTNLSATYNQVRTNDILSSRIMNFRINGSYNIKKNQSLTIFANMLRKFGTIQNDEQFNEFTTTISYSYSF